MSADRRRDLRDMLDELDKYFETFERDIQDTVKDALTTAHARVDPYVAGFSFHIGPEGKPTVQFFGDKPNFGIGIKSPLTEQILDEKTGRLVVVVDMPGVEKEDIEVETSEEQVVVKAVRGNRRYRAEVQLKSLVDPASGKAEYKNGVLEISFSSKDKDNKAYRRVDIV